MMKNPVLLTLFLLLCGSLPVSGGEKRIDHALYLAVIQVDHSAPGQAALIQVKVFTDDLHSAVRNAFPDRYLPGSPEGFLEKNASLVEAYFTGHFRCRINGQDMPVQLSGGTPENDVYLLTFRMPAPEKWRSLHLTADFFMELFPTQSNVVQVIHGGEKRFGRLTKKETSCAYDF